MPMKTLMARLFNPPYNLLGTVGGLLFLCSFLYYGRTVDFHFHDTYFVIATDHLLLMAGCYLLFLWIVYQSIHNRPASKLLTNIHVWTTLAVVAICTFLFLNQPRSYIDYSMFRERSLLTGLLTILFLLVQVLFLANVFIALLRRKGKRLKPTK